MRPIECFCLSPSLFPSQLLQDPSFLSDVLSGLEGVDPDDQGIRDAVSDLASKVDKKGDKDGKDGAGKK